MKNLFIGMVLSILFTACYDEPAEESYETVVVKRRSMASTVLATGAVKPKVGAEVRVGSRVSGIVKNLNVFVGDVVKKGDGLARLDDVEFIAQYNQAAANLDNAKAVLKYAKIEKERQENLFEKTATPRQMYDQAMKAYEIAQTQVAQAEANLDYTKIQLEYTKIFAPIDGAIASVSTQEGETVAAAFSAPTFLTIIDLKRMEVRAYVDETDISKVQEGQKAEFTVDTYTGVVFEGVVTAIYPKAEIIDNVVNYIVIVDITENKDKILRPEMTTTVNIFHESLDNVIAIPNKAITRSNNEELVRVLKDGKPEERKIITGIKNKSLTQVVSGLEENEILILNQ